MAMSVTLIVRMSPARRSSSNVAMELKAESSVNKQLAIGLIHSFFFFFNKEKPHFGPLLYCKVFNYIMSKLECIAFEIKLSSHG